MLSQIEGVLQKIKWRVKNKHNFTRMKRHFNGTMVSVGKGTYGDLIVHTYNDKDHLRIGNYCSIGPDVHFILSADHALDHLLTYPFKVKYMGAAYEAVSKGDIVVGDDVWIGTCALILSGVTIGRGAVIGAGSVITHDVPPYAIVAGVPARVLRYRFSQEIRDKLMTLDYSRLDADTIRNASEILYRVVDDGSVDEIIEQLTGSSPGGGTAALR